MMTIVTVKENFSFEGVIMRIGKKDGLLLIHYLMHFVIRVNHHKILQENDKIHLNIFFIY